MKEKLAKMIDVKSIMTLLMTGAFVYLAINGVLTAEQFLTTFTLVVSFYFGVQTGKDGKNDKRG